MLKRKEKILIGALELLEAGGINGLTTKKLAAQQGVSEPALYRQFKGKLDIVIGLIGEYASFDDKIMNTIAESEMRGKEAIQFYITKFAERYKNYSEITTIMFSMDVYYYNDVTKAMMEAIYKTRIDFLCQIIMEGQEAGLIDHRFGPEELAGLIDGIIFSRVYAWRMSGKTTLVKEEILTTVMKLI